MKKIIFALLMTLVFMSCTDALLPAEPIRTKSQSLNQQTTLQIVNNLKLYPADEFVNGSLWEVELHYFNGDNLIKTVEINSILTGDTINIDVLPDYEKLKISFKLAPEKLGGVANCRRFTRDYIIINSDTYIYNSDSNNIDIFGVNSTIGVWTQIGKIPNIATITTTSLNSAIVSKLIPGIYTFKYSIEKSVYEIHDLSEITLSL